MHIDQLDDDEVLDDEHVQMCCITGCRRLTRALYCDKHRRALAILDTEPDEQQDLPTKA